MSDFNKSYRIRTEVGKDKQLNVKLERNYDILEVMSLNINQKNAYKFHTSDYGVIAGRVLANGALGIPNAKVSVFINRFEDDAKDPVKNILYPYNTTKTKNSDNIRYNLLPNEKVEDCHAVIGTFPSKQYMLDNDNILEIYEKYYKFTTKTNHAGDYMIFGVPTGSQTIHVDLDLSDIGILSQKPRDMVYKGYDINQFENPSKFKQDTNLDSLVQVISQDSVTDVIPFWGDEDEGSIGITRCDIDIQYKFEPTCVFLGSIVSDTSSAGISKKCIPAAKMGAMDEIVAGTGTIEMIRKKVDGSVEEFQIQGTQLINGDGVWCYQIPMNLDYVMTDEYGNMVPTDNPEKGIPTRTRVRFRMSMQDFENDSSNIFRCKILVPNNPSNSIVDYQFGSATKEESFKDLFWNGVYSVKSYIPRIQKGSNWKHEKFTGFKRVNHYGDKNPIPYNNIRIRIPFMFTIICALLKLMISFAKFFNLLTKTLHDTLAPKRSNATFNLIDGTLCSDDLDNVCIIPGINIIKIKNSDEKVTKGILARTIELFVMNYTGDESRFNGDEANDGMTTAINQDTKSIDYKNEGTKDLNNGVNAVYGSDAKSVDIYGVRVTDSVDYVIQCIEMNLAQEYKVIQFDFYNDWINGLIYIPRWARNITKKRTFLWGAFSIGGKVKACNSDFRPKKMNLVQQCGLEYKISVSGHDIQNPDGCDKKKMLCHKSTSVRKSVNIGNSGGLVYNLENSKGQFLYYFKPVTDVNGQLVKLFATDIVLLGTLNNCDRWGIPDTFSELQSSSFQIPSNLALTDSDLEGDLYDNEPYHIYFKYVKEQDNSKNGGTNVKIDRFDISSNALTKLGEDGNYTEASGIDWGYTGPLQSDGITSSNFEKAKLYRPGGHFLGLTCRNSETSVKTCVNLSRICEHGIWISQRQELQIPQPTKGSFVNIGTVPSGIISKDEVSDTVYRWHFATMNSNGLKTVKDEATGQLKYNFLTIVPTGFGGELNSKIFSTSNEGKFNRKIAEGVWEHYYNYNGGEGPRYDNYYSRTLNDKIYVPQKQIMRVGEWMDNEYWRFRFGLPNTSDNDIISLKKGKYLIKNNSGNYSFPVFENSFYFYFGLKNGATALDEFKKMYYAKCDSENELVQIDKTISIYNLKTQYNSICEGSSNGEISFKVLASKELFGETGIKITCIGDNTTQSVTADSVDFIALFSGLKDGIYTIELEAADGTKVEKDVKVNKTSITANIKGYDFIKDVTNSTPMNIFNYSRVGDGKWGGYIEFENNSFNLESSSSLKDETFDAKPTTDSDETESIFDVFNPQLIKQIIISGTTSGTTFVISNNSWVPKNFTFSVNNTVIATAEAVLNTDTNNYMIPVPFADTEYKVNLVTYIGAGCQVVPYSAAITSYIWEVGSITIKNANVLNFTYNNVSYRSYLNNLVNEGSTTSTNGWWNSTVNVMNVQPENIQWDVKEALFKSSLDNNVFSVKIAPSGGMAPYTEKITGMTETVDTVSSNLTKSDIENITIPTINYIKNNTRRTNFAYQVEDSNGQVFPETPFIFPVIYKPFFMEMGIWYFDENMKYCLRGSVYNGKTWDYRNEGFNDSKLNNVVVANIATITKPDETLELNEPGLTGGGYDYSGPYFKYNARKVSINRELEPISHGLNTSSVGNNINLSIGCSHTYGTNKVYKDHCTMNKNNLIFFTYGIQTNEGNGKYQIKMNVNVDLNASEEGNRQTYIINTSDYKYPFSNKMFTIEENLHKAIMNGTLTNSQFTGYDSSTGYINVESCTGGSVYYLTVYDTKNGEAVSSSNSENKLKAISVSNIIDLNSIVKFYPLEIEVESTTYMKKLNGSYDINVKFKAGGSDKSKENFKNKKYTFVFYTQTGGESDNRMILQSITKSNGESTSFRLDLTPYRNILGFNDGDRGLYYYVEVEANGIKSPTRYNDGDLLSFPFTNNAQTV